MRDERLDSGLTVSQAVAQASSWWDKTGRFLMDKRVNEIVTTKLRTGGDAPAVKTTTHDRDLASGILNGLTWDELNRREQLQVVKTWHHYTQATERKDAELTEQQRRLRLDGV